MIRSFISRHLTTVALAICLAACGGGGAGGLNSMPSPTPTPTPTPTPSCSTPPCFSKVEIFPAINATTEFAAVGAELPAAGSSNLTTTGFSVRYDAATNSYIMDFPSTAAGEFKEYSDNSPNATWWGGAVVNSAGQAITREVSVLRPSNPDVTLTYTTLAGYNYLSVGEAPFGWVAFGTATQNGAVPVTGSATYNALVAGSTADAWGMIQGAASLTFDFGAGELSGQMSPVYLYLGGMGESYSLGRYVFVNTVYASGSTHYSGHLSHADFSQLGSFSGQFTGPTAQELMAQWSAPFRDPITHVDSQMFGVWVGRRGN